MLVKVAEFRDFSLSSHTHCFPACGQQWWVFKEFCFYSGKAGKGDMYSTCIFLRLSVNHQAQPHSTSCQAEQVIKWVSLSPPSSKSSDHEPTPPSVCLSSLPPNYKKDFKLTNIHQDRQANTHYIAYITHTCMHYVYG